MLRIWLKLALPCALLASGCYGTHGDDSDASLLPPDAGPLDASRPPGPDAFLPEDAGVCRLLPGRVTRLECVPALDGQPAHVVVESHPGLCCETGAPQIRLDSLGPASSVVDLEWLACACCETCNCIGPQQESRVELVPAPDRVHTVESADGRHRCTFEPIVEPPGCEPVAHDLRAARHVFVDDPISFTATTPPRGCGCTPRLDMRRGGVDWRSTMSLCDCQMEPCVDGPYESSEVVAAEPAARSYGVVGPIPEASFRVHSRDECRSASAVDVVVVPPAPPHVTSGPRLHWARTEVMEQVCCVEPQPLVRLANREGNDLFLEPYSCVQEDCDCLPAPTITAAWTSLGELEPGAYRVHIGDAITTEFVVP